MSESSPQGSVSPNAASTNHGMASEVSRLKRQLASMQEELEEANHAKAKKPPYV